jgi:hypothetical protein
MKMDRVQNIETSKRMGTDTDTVESIEERRLKWYGHMQAMYDNCWPKRICAWRPLNRRKRGRPRRTWRDDADEVTEERGLQEGD